jgi:Flp pilus assembly protein TadD
MTREKSANLLICLLLLLAVVALYAPVARHPFINYDDTQYLLENPNVAAGLTLHNLRWAFTSFYQANWHPITWLSHMLDVELFDLAPGGHHLTNVLLHAANTLLLYLFLFRTTAARWPSALVAALFALHPLHVESVAWVAERKDVLSTFFGMATLLAYARHARTPGPAGYLLTLGFFALGLMSKPMLVTLPCLLLLLDIWPLCRQRTGLVRLVVEKLPLLSMSAGASWITYTAQNTGIVNASLPLKVKLASALVAYAIYLRRMVWPSGLAILYPFEPAIPGWEVAAAGLLLSTVTVLALRQRKRFPYLPVGWFWYLGTLVPVIGLVSVGYQATADRYTYVPLVGIFIMLAWGAADFAGRSRRRQKVVAATATVILVCLACTARWQLGFWRSSIALFSRTVAVTAGNYVAWNNLGVACQLEGMEGAAIRAYATSLAMNPAQVPPHNNLGLILAHQGRLGEAATHYRAALAMQPDYSDASSNLGVALLRQGDLQGAVRQFARSVHVVLDSDDLVNRFSLGLGLIRGGRYAEAMARFDAVARSDPGHAKDYARLGSELIRLGSRLDQ